jgi:CheY-like chemotaxis protein
MCMCDASVVQTSATSEPIPDEAFEYFKSRRRIVLHEPYPALRSVIARSLIRLGCVVTFKRSHDEVCALLQDADYLYGAITSVDGDPTTAVHQIEHLRAANRHQIPLILLTNWPVGPDQRAEWRHAGMTALSKPFDMRDLLVSLNM